MGQIYAIMNNFYYIQSLKKEFELREEVSDLYNITNQDIAQVESIIDKKVSQVEKEHGERINQASSEKEKKKIQRELQKQTQRLKEKISDAIKLNEANKDFQARFGKKYKLLLAGVKKIDLMKQTGLYLQAFSNNSDQRIVEQFYEVVYWVLDGFKHTLSRYNINFDQFDYESKVTQSGLPDKLITNLQSSENIKKIEGKAIRYSYPQKSISEFLDKTGLTKNDLPIKGQIPDLQLTRQDGTALYAAKDIAYSIYKFENRKADRVYNVISAEQTLPQFQLLLPLFDLGYTDVARDMKHYSYENVELKGRIMSGRLATYVTADDFLDETIVRSRMAKRKSEQERNVPTPRDHKEYATELDIITKVAIAATRFPLIETSPRKRIILDLDRELDFRRNSGPFIQYAHARAHGVLTRAKKEKQMVGSLKINESLVVDDDSIEIVQHLIDIEKLIIKSVEMLDPSIIASWCFDLGLKFMKYYEKFPVLNASSEDQAKATLAIIQAVKNGLVLGLNLLGIPPTERL